MTHTDAETQCNIQVEDIPVQTTDNLLTRNVKDSSQQGQRVQVHREVQAIEGLGTFADCFLEFKEGIIAKQEKSFVDALVNFSKVHSNISALQAQIQKLTQEKEDLLKQKQKNKEPSTQKVPECRCKELESKVEEYSKEAHSLQQKLFRMTLNKEIEFTKHQGSTKIQKLESAHTQMNILYQDIKAFGKKAGP